jgi:hypothetical protein
MFFVQADSVIDGVTYTRRVGNMTTSFSEAKAKAIKRRGYIVNESRKLIGQAMDETAPLFLGSLRNISSGEDALC